MFIGHYAVALGARRYAAPASLGTLFMACQLADLIWPNLVLLGIEKVEVDPGNTALTPLNFVSYPYSHSLVGLVLWSLLFGIAYALLARTPRRVPVVLALVVFSHWILDVLSHRPDMPLSPGSSVFLGLGLWNLPVAAVSLELLLFAVGTWSYVKFTQPVDRTGSVAFWSLIGFLLLVYAANVLGPPPPSARAVAWSAQAMWLLVAWGYWVDRHRSPRDHAKA
jgi:membrane-bound metal-dependent hydrolase YbcI (DUF457 family)